MAVANIALVGAAHVLDGCRSGSLLWSGFGSGRFYPQIRRSYYLFFIYLSYYLYGEGLISWKTPQIHTSLWK